MQVQDEEHRKDPGSVPIVAVVGSVTVLVTSF